MKNDKLRKAFNTVIDKKRNSSDIDYDYLSFSFKAGKGHFKVRIHDLICKFNQTDFKKVMTLLSEDTCCYDKAINLHDLISDIAGVLIESKKGLNIDTKVELNEALNRLKKLNSILIDVFGVPDIDVEAKPKFSNVIAYKQYNDTGIEIDLNAKSIVLYGYRWIISKNRDYTKQYDIIVPSCGIRCNSFTGSINKAIELITPELLERVLKALENFDYSHYLELLNERGIDSLPEFKAA